jgi:hypothetical protein
LVLFPNLYTILSWEFYFLPFSVPCPNQSNLCSLVSVMVGFLRIV